MARRRAKKTVKRVGWTDLNGAEAKEPKNDKQQAQFTDPDVEQQIAAIRAIRDVGIEHLLTELRLIRSHFTEEQLQNPLLQFFQENLPNLSVSRNGENGLTEVQGINKDGQVSMNNGSDLHGSLLHQLSMVYSNCVAASAIPSMAGFEFSGKAVKTSLLDADNLHIREFVISQMLPIGKTLRTLRLPKPGEVLLSVHGSPLGVYKEDNLESIHELEEGWLASNCSSSQ